MQQGIKTAKDSLVFINTQQNDVLKQNDCPHPECSELFVSLGIVYDL